MTTSTCVGLREEALEKLSRDLPLSIDEIAALNGHSRRTFQRAVAERRWPPADVMVGARPRWSAALVRARLGMNTLEGR